MFGREHCRRSYAYYHKRRYASEANPMKTYFAATTLAVLSALPIQAEQQGDGCMPRDDIVAALRGRFHEARRAIWLSNNGTVLMELFVNTDTGSMTLLATRPDGISCVAVAGVDYIEVEAAPEGEAL